MGNRGLSRTLGLGNKNKEFQSIAPLPSKNETSQEEKIEIQRKRKVAEVGRIDDDQVKDATKQPNTAAGHVIDFKESEGKLRRENLANYETECSQISKFIFVSGMKVAADYDLLVEKGIKRIVNCAPLVAPNFHENSGTFKYLTINLVDGRVEDISWFVCQVIYFIKEGVIRGERVLIHCEKGVSRSCSIAIAHRMWQTGESWKVSFDFVKTQRRICSPNTAFTVNLIELTELFSGGASHATLLYRLAYHAAYDCDTPVLKLCRNDANRRILVPATSLLNPKAVFVLKAVRPNSGAASVGINNSNSNNNNEVSNKSAESQSAQHELFVWFGKESTQVARDAVMQLSRLMIDVLSRAMDVRIVREGEEPVEFLSCLAADGPFQRQNSSGVSMYNDYFGACQPTETELQEAAALRFAASSITQEFLRTMGHHGQHNQASQSSFASETVPPTSATVSRNNSNARLTLNNANNSTLLPLNAAMNTSNDDGPLSDTTGSSVGAAANRSRSNTGNSAFNANINNNNNSNSNTNDIALSIPAALSRANSFSSIDSDGQPALSREERLSRIHNIIDAAVNNNSSAASPNVAPLSLSLSLAPAAASNSGSLNNNHNSHNASSHGRSSKRGIRKRSRGGIAHGAADDSNNTSSASDNDHEASSSSSRDSYSATESPVFPTNRNKGNSDHAFDRRIDSESSMSVDALPDDPSESLENHRSAKRPALKDSKVGGFSLALPLSQTAPQNSAIGMNDNSIEITSSNTSDSNTTSMARSSSKPRFVPAIGLYPLTEVRDSASNSVVNTSRPASAAPSSATNTARATGMTLSLTSISTNNTNNNNNHSDSNTSLPLSSSRSKLPLSLPTMTMPTSISAALADEDTQLSLPPVSRRAADEVSAATVAAATVGGGLGSRGGSVASLALPTVTRLPTLSMNATSSHNHGTAYSGSQPQQPPPTTADRKAPSKPLLFQVVRHSDDDADEQAATMGKWAAMGVYDDEDLEEGNALLLLCPGQLHYLWIGSDSPIYESFTAYLETLSDTPYSHRDIGEWLQSNVAIGELSDWEIRWLEDDMVIEQPGQESDIFWEKFNEGF